MVFERHVARLALGLAGAASASVIFPVAARAEQQPAIAAPAPVDHAPDIAARTSTARRELGPKTPVQVVEGAFVFAAPPGNEAGLRSSTAFAKSVLAALTNGRFPRLPSKPVTVLLFFGRAPYEKYCKDVLGEPCISSFGFFRHDLRAIVMNASPGLGTLSHELVHPLVEEDFPNAPIWLNEGIASLYEAPALGKPGEIRGVKNWRHPRLATALRAKSAKVASGARLETLFALDDEAFRKTDEDLHYAMARYLCQWLESQGKLWTFYAKFREGQRDDPRGLRAFTEVVGQSPADAQAAWSRWVLAL